ncbi:hypothetical protein ACLOJK_016601 [Asimina triloba]
MKNFDGHVSSCMIKRLVRGNGGCSNLTIGDVTRKWGSELRSLDDGCMLSDYEGGKDQMCGFCLRKWDEIGGSFHISDTVDKADENVCRFAILVTLMSSRINDERWVQANRIPIKAAFGGFPGIGGCCSSGSQWKLCIVRNNMSISLVDVSGMSDGLGVDHHHPWENIAGIGQFKSFVSNLWSSLAGGNRLKSHIVHCQVLQA